LCEAGCLAVVSLVCLQLRAGARTARFVLEQSLMSVLWPESDADDHEVEEEP
jgi:hypothetical protein